MGVPYDHECVCQGCSENQGIRVSGTWFEALPLTGVQVMTPNNGRNWERSVQAGCSPGFAWQGANAEMVLVLWRVRTSLGCTVIEGTWCPLHLTFFFSIWMRCEIIWLVWTWSCMDWLHSTSPKPRVLFFHRSFPARNYEAFVTALSTSEKSISSTGQALRNSFNLSFLFSLFRAHDCNLTVDVLNHAWL